MSELIFGVVIKDSSGHGYKSNTVILVGPMIGRDWYIVKEFENTACAKLQVSMNKYDFALLPTYDMYFSANQEVIYVGDDANPEVKAGDIMIVRAIHNDDYICEMKNEKNAFNIVTINDITPLIL